MTTGYVAAIGCLLDGVSRSVRSVSPIRVLPLNIACFIQFEYPEVSLAGREFIRLGSTGDDVATIPRFLVCNCIIVTIPTVSLLPLDSAVRIQLDDPKILVTVIQGRCEPGKEIALVGCLRNREDIFVSLKAISTHPITGWLVKFLGIAGPCDNSQRQSDPASRPLGQSHTQPCKNKGLAECCKIGQNPTYI